MGNIINILNHSYSVYIMEVIYFFLIGLYWWMNKKTKEQRNHYLEETNKIMMLQNKLRKKLMHMGIDPNTMPITQNDYLEVSRFLLKNMSMDIDPKDWPSQRRYLTFWIKEFNAELFRSSKDIGKLVELKMFGDNGEDVLNKDKPKSEKLVIGVTALDKEEKMNRIMSRLKGLKK